MDPLGNVFRRRIHGQDGIEVLMVELFYHILDMMEVDDHPIFIQFFPAAGHFNDPVVPVKAGTFAFLRKPECMGTAHFHPFCYRIHHFSSNAGSGTPLAAKARARSIQVPQVPQGRSPPS